MTNIFRPSCYNLRYLEHDFFQFKPSLRLPVYIDNETCKLQDKLFTVMKRTKCNEMKIAEHIETNMQIDTASKSAASNEEVVQIIPDEYHRVKLEPEEQEELHAVMDMIECEETKIAGQFETIYIQPSTLSENYVAQSSEQSLKFSKVLLQLTKDKPSLCRLCATQGNDMVYMFGQNELYKNIIEKIEHCLPIMVKQTDTLSKQACRMCLEKLEMCYEFHNCVSEAEKQLLMFDEQTLEEHCQTSLLCNNEESQFEQNNCYSAPNNPMNPVHSGKELVSDFELYFPLVSGNTEASDSLKTEPKEDKSDDNISFCETESNYQKIVERDCNKSANKFVSQLKQNFQKLCQQPTENPHCIPGEQIRIGDGENPNAYQRKMDPFVKCNFCKKKFNSHLLVVHKEACKKLLAGKKLHLCVYCGKEFDYKGDLNAHIRTHTEERLYGCHYCTQKFKHRSTRDDHHRFHTGRGLIQCSFCEKTFTRTSRLERHERTHKKFRCPLCDAMFNSGNARYQHALKCRKDKRYQCDVCGTYLRNKSNLQRHKRTQHPQIDTNKSK